MKTSIKELKRRIALDTEYDNIHFKQKNGWIVIPKEGQAQKRKDLGFKVTNAQRARVEINDFKHSRPDKYTGYMHKAENGYTISNWTGLTLCDNVVIRSIHKKFNSYLSDAVYYFHCIGINGQKYRGIGYGAGVYCHLYALK
jgi:hypothetical protein